MRNIIPKEDSLQNRLNTIKIFKSIIKENNPNWKVYLYGSFGQNISTIHSDLDFSVICNENTDKIIEPNKVYNHLNYSYLDLSSIFNKNSDKTIKIIEPNTDYNHLENIKELLIKKGF